MVAPRPKLKPGYLSAKGRISRISANQDNIPEGRCLVTIDVAGENHVNTLKLLVPDHNACYLFGADCEIVIMPKRDGEDVKWLAAEEE